MDITILLTRALGRELIKHLLTRRDPLLITSGHNQYNHEKHTLYLDKQSIGSHVTRLPTKDKEGFFTLTPRFTTLAHELIHAYHYQLFDPSLMEQLKGNPTLDTNYHSLNEQLTIVATALKALQANTSQLMKVPFVLAMVYAVVQIILLERVFLQILLEISLFGMVLSLYILLLR